MRSTLIATIVTIAACGSALATNSVSFEAQGYLLDIVVGYSTRPIVAGLSIAVPGNAGNTGSVAIPLKHLKIEVFDTEQKLLVLRFTNPGDPKLPNNFSLTVKNDAGILQFEGKSIAGRFAWGM